MPKPGNAPCGGAGKGNRVKGEADEHPSEEEFVSLAGRGAQKLMVVLLHGKISLF